MPVIDVYSFFRQKQSFAETIASIRDQQPKSTHRVSPDETEIAGEDDEFFPSPLCPTCGNLDPRSYLNTPTLDAINCTKQVSDIPTSIIVTVTYASSGDLVQCLACNTSFLFSAHGNPYSQDGGPKNMGKATKAYVQLLLEDSKSKWKVGSLMSWLSRLISRLTSWLLRLT